MLTYWAALDALRELYARAGVTIPVSETGERRPWHSLRHTFGTECAARGVPITTLQELMGHEDIETTQRYVTVTRQHWHDAIAALRGSKDRNHYLTYLNNKRPQRDSNPCYLRERRVS